MSPSSLYAALLFVSAVLAQSPTGTYPAVPLASKHFASPADLPYQVDSDQGLIRGTQKGFNICNGTTENQDSLCQTSYFTDISDFCLWAPSKPNSVVADTEGEMVAWCTKPGHGTRLIPQGALTGLQVLRTPDYMQVVGFIDQTQINLASDDWGGEMDPHGADLRGNPMGGVLFSGAFGGKLQQVIEWTNFMGGNAFCLKVCDPAGPNAASYCQHIYDRIGCAYNVPNAAQDKVFETCQGDNADFPGIYTSNGVVVTYTQPAESLGAISTMPYQPRVPASSNCSPIVSSAVYTGLPKPTAATPTTSSAASGSATGLSTTRATGAAASVSKTGVAAGASATSTSGAERLALPVLSLAGVVFAAAFLS